MATVCLTQHIAYESRYVFFHIGVYCPPSATPKDCWLITHTIACMCTNPKVFYSKVFLLTAAYISLHRDQLPGAYAGRGSNTSTIRHSLSSPSLTISDRAGEQGSTCYANTLTSTQHTNGYLQVPCACQSPTSTHIHMGPCKCHVHANKPRLTSQFHCPHIPTLTGQVVSQADIR